MLICCTKIIPRPATRQAANLESEKVMCLTKPQRVALKRVFSRDNQGLSYLAFRRGVVPGHGCIMVRWSGMWLGIELDGYTHS